MKGFTLRRVAKALLGGGKRSSRGFVPPAELILENNIGTHDKEHIVDEYKRVGARVASKIKDEAGVRPESDVLDVGCGTGRVAMYLTDYLTTGSYTGIDIVKSSVEWCKNAFRDYRNFHFIHADLYSQFYNPNASSKAEEYRFPFEDDSFDVVWSSSLFTHLFLPAVDNYLKEMARVVRPGGIVWNSYLALDEVSEPLVLGPRNDGRRMRFEADGARFGYKARPEHIVGLRRDRVLELHEKHGLEIVEERLSNWSGGRPELETRDQDAIIARKRSVS